MLQAYPKVRTSNAVLGRAAVHAASAGTARQGYAAAPVEAAPAAPAPAPPSEEPRFVADANAKYVDVWDAFVVHARELTRSSLKAECFVQDLRAAHEQWLASLSLDDVERLAARLLQEKP